VAIPPQASGRGGGRMRCPQCGLVMRIQRPRCVRCSHLLPRGTPDRAPGSGNLPAQSLHEPEEHTKAHAVPSPASQPEATLETQPRSGGSSTLVGCASLVGLFALAGTILIGAEIGASYLLHGVLNAIPHPLLGIAVFLICLVAICGITVFVVGKVAEYWLSKGGPTGGG
jgi:hypothetical protein